jgi:hypothetical protein
MAEDDVERQVEKPPAQSGRRSLHAAFYIAYVVEDEILQHLLSLMS